MAAFTPITPMTHVPYKYSVVSDDGEVLIVGKRGDPNPLADRQTRLLPINKLRIGESLRINKLEMPKWKWQLAKTTVKRYNREYADTCRFVESDKHLEIVRIK